MDGLELRVRERRVDEWKEGVVVQECLPGAKAFHQPVRRRRHEGSAGERRAWRSDPVLASPELARRGRVSPHSAHELFVQFAHQAQRQRQFAQTRHAVLERNDVVANLAQIRGGLRSTAAPASEASSSPSVARVPSIRLDSTASRRMNGRSSRCGFASRRPSPARRPSARSATESAAARSALHAIGGGRGAGT